MATTTGAADRKYEVHRHHRSPGSRRPSRREAGRQRLLTAVQDLRSMVWGQDGLSPVVRGRHPGGQDTVAGEQVGGIESSPVPVRPRPADKPTTVAHYQAMAEQVALERRRADLDSRLAVRDSHVDVSRRLWLATSGPLDSRVCHG